MKSVNRTIKPLLWLCALGLGLAVRSLCVGAPTTDLRDPGASIDSKTLRQWSKPYRTWTRWPEHVIPRNVRVGEITNLLCTDAPTVYQIPGSNKWYMSFVGFDGKGCQSFVAESDDLLHWGNYRLAMGYGPDNSFDHGGCVVCACLYDSCEVKAPRMLKRLDGKFWALYAACSRQGGFELPPGSQGLAVSDDGLTWKQASPQPVLSVFDEDCAKWEQASISQPWLVEYQGHFLDFYNATDGQVAQSGLAFSTDLLNWMRYPANPVMRNRKDAGNALLAPNPKVYRDGDHWSMFYLGASRHSADVMYAASRDLIHWIAHQEPIYKSGGNPGGLDNLGPRKISLVFNPGNETFYLFYSTLPGQTGSIAEGCGIGLLTSKPIQ
jgi:predicted GH43/DUF377 family glycosyl hydrolase